jgi:CRP/FNR family transcriptional regulator, cyclic AMP receptor protein
MDDISTLKNVQLFGSMDEQELTALRGVMGERRFVPGQVIIRQGEPGDHFHVISEGRVQFSTVDADGHELPLGEAGPGAFFGELSMLTGEPRTARVKALDSVRTLTLGRDELHAFLLKYPHAAINVLTEIARRLHKTDAMLRQSVSRNVNVIADEKSTLGQRIADGFATMMGSWTFIIVQTVLLAIWVTLNAIAWEKRWDPYPFILLNLVLSFQSAYAAPIIMMSQNRSSEKDRLAAEIDHQVNVKAEIKTGQIISRLDDLERAMHALHQEQVAMLRPSPDGDGVKRT